MSPKPLALICSAMSRFLLPLLKNPLGAIVHNGIELLQPFRRRQRS